jgi:hypothetical protein
LIHPNKDKRKYTRLQGAILHELEEAGEDDLCGLLNVVQKLHPSYGTGPDLIEYLEAIAVLESHGELKVQMYQQIDGRDVFGEHTLHKDDDRLTPFKNRRVRAILALEILCSTPCKVDLRVTVFS